MNRGKLEAMRPQMKRWHHEASMGDLAMILDALLESPDAGPESPPRWRDGVEERLQGLARRIEQLEYLGTALEAAQGGLLRTVNNLKAGVPDVEPSAYKRLDALEARTREVTPADTLQALTSVEARMDRLEAERYGPPDVGPTHEWVTEAEAAPKDMKEVLTTLGRQLTQIDPLGPAAGGLAPKRGATPCPVCLSNICRGDVDARGCDTRAATRKAITP